MHKRALLLAVALLLTSATPAAAWEADAERIAAEYATAQGWTDACQGAFTWTVEPTPGAAGWASVETCWFAVSPKSAKRPDTGCLTYVHERLHLWRGDTWHSDDPAHPLYHGNTNTNEWFMPCLALTPHETCTPGWVRKSSRRVRRLWNRGDDYEARDAFRAWAKRHPRKVQRARTAARRCVSD